MKKNTHPKYQQVLFVDSSTGYRFVCGSTLNPKEREVFEGKEYPVYHVSISSASHPFFIGGKQLVDTEGRVTRFANRYANVQKKHQEQQAAASEAAKKPPSKKKTKK